MSDPIRIQRRIYEGDSLSPLWFCLALNPLSYLLNRTNCGFGIHSGNQEMQRLNHPLYMDDIKLYAATINYKNFYGSLKLFQESLKWYLGLKKKTLCIAKEKLEMRNFTTQDDDTMEAMNENGMYRCIDMQAKQIKHARMKQKLGEEYLNRTKRILKTKLNGKNTLKLSILMRP